MVQQCVSHKSCNMYPRLLKSRAVFTIGFAIGFAFALLLFQSQDALFSESSCARLWRHKHSVKENSYRLPVYNMFRSDKEVLFQSWIKGDAPANKTVAQTYNQWLEKHQLKSIRLDQDAFLYGPGRIQGNLSGTESSFLSEKIHITCVVFIEKVNLGRAINGTWGQHCNNIFFFGQKLSSPKLKIIDVKMKLHSSWQLLCEAMNHVWKESSNLEWIIFVKDDTIVIPENLRYMVAPLNHTHDYYLGHTIVMWGQPYNVAQAGYVLSVGAMEKIVNKFNTSEKCLAGGKYWKKEDYYLAKHLTSLGVKPSDTRDQYLRSTFHRYSLPNLLWGAVNPDDNWTPIYQSCCSPLTVTFSSGETDKMYTYHYLLYHLQALVTLGTYGGRPGPTPIPEEDVWKAVLREEFNITYWQNITKEKYYEIWSNSDKEKRHQQLTTIHYESMPDVLSSVLTAYELQQNTSLKHKAK